MIDREKVIKGIECCLDPDGEWAFKCDECPYRATEEERKHLDWDCHKDELQSDTLALLKAEMPV